MTDALPIRIADAIATEINAAAIAGTLGINSFEARRSYGDWDDDFSDIKDVAVDVIHSPEGAISAIARNRTKNGTSVFVAVRKRFCSEDREATSRRLLNDAIDPYVTLLEEIYELFAARRSSIIVDATTSVSWDGREAVVRWVTREKLRQGLFEGWVEIATHATQTR